MTVGVLVRSMQTLQMNIRPSSNSGPPPSCCQIRVWKQGGVHPGDALEEWVHEQLAEHGAGTLAELREKCDLSGIHFEGGDQEEIQHRGRFLLQV